VWILLVELIRPHLPFFSTDAASAEAAAAHQRVASAAAWIGLFRGSLWTDYAITLAPNLAAAAAREPSPATLASLDGARTAAVLAAELAPHDARAWLLIAEADLRRLDHNVARALKMSYYTGPNELALIPSRIDTATRSDAIADSDLQILVSGEIRTIIMRKRDLKPLILAAYRNALPEGKRFIEDQVGDLDPALIASLRATDSSAGR
jgi:hypothetical protein